MNLLEAEETNKPLSSVAWTLAATIGMLLCFVQAGVMASLLAGRTGFAAVFPCATGVSILVGYMLLRRARVARRGQWVAAALFLLVLGASLALSAFFFDFSFDGQWYHQAAIIHTGQDWNPLTDPIHPFANNVGFGIGIMQKAHGTLPRLYGLLQATSSGASRLTGLHCRHVFSRFLPRALMPGCGDDTHWALRS